MIKLLDDESVGADDFFFLLGGVGSKKKTTATFLLRASVLPKQNLTG